MSPEYLFVRYMGPKICNSILWVEEEAVGDFMKTIKEKVEALEIETEDYKGEKQ